MMEDLADPKTMLVMIVEDEPKICELLEFVFKSEGFQVDRAEDGQEALEKIGKARPHLILLDLMLPRHGGFEVLRQLQIGSAARIPIIVLSGRYTDRSTAEMVRRESNVVEFFEKPVKPLVLTQLAHKILKTRPPEKKVS